jgi:hypothetical protein
LCFGDLSHCDCLLSQRKNIITDYILGVVNISPEC